MAQQWVAVKWLPNRGKEGAFAFACQAEGRKPWDFYTTVKKAGGRKEEACRIARLCYAKFQAGAADAEVMEYRDSLCRELTAGQPLPRSHKKRPASTAPRQKQAQNADQTTNNLKTETNQPARQQGANHQSPSMTKDSKQRRGGSSKLLRRRPQKCPTCRSPFLNQKSYDKHVAA
ncbi:unnamed protein product, partial [Polarella glacialis]